jgi:hypothetical protein
VATRSLANVDTTTIRLTGTTPLVMDNIEHADPDDKIAREIKKITDKSQLTDEDRHRKDRLAYVASLYLEGGRLVVPWAALRRALATGAYYIGGTSLSGKVDKGVSCAVIDAPLEYDGPEPDKLFDDERFRLRKMVNKNPTGKKAMVATIRPVFPEWSAAFPVTVFNDICGFDDFVRALQATGATIGVGNARKLGYGRFTVRAVKNDAA